MSRRTPATETKTVSETRSHLSETLDRVYRGESRVIVERSGIPVGAIVSVADLEALDRLDQERRETLDAFRAARAAFVGESPEEIEREIEQAIAEVRRERRRRQQQTEPRSA